LPDATALASKTENIGLVAGSLVVSALSLVALPEEFGVVCSRLKVLKSLDNENELQNEVDFLT
jgi:hypothetical protein